GMPRNLGNTVAITLFDASFLPQALVISAAVNALIAVTLNVLQKHLSFLRLGYLNLSIQFVSLLAFYGLFRQYGEDTSEGIIVGIVFYIWMQVIMVLSYKEYWDLAARVLDIQQSKRLFPIIGAGEILFIIPIGLLGSFITWIGVPNLLLFGLLGIVGSFLSVAVITKRYRALINKPQIISRRRTSTTTETTSSKSTLITRYVFLIMTLSVVYIFGFAVLRQLYLDGLDAQFAGDAAEKSAFLLLILGVTGGLNLIMRLFFADDFMSRFGVAGGLLILPMLAIVASSGLSITLEAGASFIGIGFALIVIVRGLYMVLKSSVERPAALILFQTFDGDTRQRLLTIRDGIVEPIAAGVAGLGLLQLTNMGFGSVIQADILTLLIALWIVVAVFTLRDYASRVTRVLKRRSVSIFSELFQDGRNLDRIRENLDSPKPMEVLYALHVLDSVETVSLVEPLMPLVAHPSEIVREEVMRLVEKRRLREFLPQAIEALDDANPKVRAAAVRAVGVLGEDDVYDTLLNFLSSQDDDVRINAIVGLLRSGDLQGVINAGNQLMRFASSDVAHEREVAAQILGEVANRKFYRLLVNLLDDDDIKVRNEAIKAAGKIKNPKLWSQVVDSLRKTHTRSSAILALGEADADVLPEFDRLFADDAVDDQVKISIARICARMNAPEATDFLCQYWTISDLNVRMAVLEALAYRDYNATPETTPEIISALREEVTFTLWCADSIRTLRESEKTEIVLSALQLEIDQAIERAFQWVSFISESQLIMSAQKEMPRASKNEWALILEALDQVIDNEVKLFVMPLFERLSVDALWDKLHDQFPEQASLTAEEVLTGIISENDLWIDPWLRTSAIYVVPEIGASDDLARILYEVMKTHDGIVAETALWSLSRVAPSMYRLYLAQRLRDSGDDLMTTTGLTEDSVGFIRKTYKGGSTVLLTIEKVLVLKNVGIFSTTSEEFLADIATLMEEEVHDADTIIIEQGTEPSFMYVVLEGELKVTADAGDMKTHDDDVELAILSDNDIFGEMSFFLNDAKHTATVTTTTQTHVLKLHHEDFEEIMYDYPQVTQGIIREFARRLRESNERVVDLGA
ncbi:MAG: HEAT repeat domain-containing protein, partial [Chloroflexota bacterium]